MADLLRRQRRAVAANNRCADCDDALVDRASISLSFGVLVCAACGEVHGAAYGSVRSAADALSADEVGALEAAGNAHVNSVYERYLPAGRKLRPDADPAAREEYIVAKYSARRFSTPQAADAEQQDQPEQQTTQRLVDYFFVAGAGKVLPGQEGDSPTTAQFGCRVVDSFPLEPHADCPLPDHVAQFMFPDGVRLRTEPSAPTLFTFVLTDVSGTKMFGSALTSFDALAPLEVVSLFDGEVPAWVQGAAVFAPKCLTLLSHYPFFSVFNHYLKQLYRTSVSAPPLPIERYIGNFVCEIPLPPEGLTKVQCTLPSHVVEIARPPPNQLPLLDVSLRPLFQLLSVDNVLLVVAYLLTECKVALCAEAYSLLTPVAESFLALLFPFAWQGAYIPVMPRAMWEMLDAPVPFLVGVHSEYLEGAYRPEGVLFVNLDRNEVLLPEDQPQPVLPSKERAKLRQALQQHAPIFAGVNAAALRADVAFPHGEDLQPITYFSSEQGVTTHHGQDSAAGGGTTGSDLFDAAHNEGGADGFSADKVRAAFLRFFVSVFRTYEPFMRRPTEEDPHPESYFDREGFLGQRGGSGHHLEPACHGFVRLMLQSQMFEHFCELRAHSPDLPEILFFDQSIVAKLNRSKLRGTKGSTEWLDDASAVHSQTFVAPAPSNWGLPAGTTYEYNGFPRLRRDRYGAVRPPRQLFTRAAHRRYDSKMKARSQELVASLTARGVALEPRRSTVAVGGPAGAGAGAGAGDTTGDDDWQLTMRHVAGLQAAWRRHVARQRFLKARRAAGVVQQFVRARKAGAAARAEFEASLRAAVAVQALARGGAARRAAAGRRAARREERAAVAVQALARGAAARRAAAGRRAAQRQTRAAVAVQAWARGAAQRRRFRATAFLAARLQAWARMTAQRRRFRATAFLATRLQAWARMAAQRRRFRATVYLVGRVQAVARGRRKRALAAAERAARVAALREQIVALWTEKHTALLYRSQFWILFDGSDFLDVAVHEGEVARLRDTAAQSVAVSAQRLAEERQQLYEKLKREQGEGTRNSFYQMFGIPANGKKRKRALADLVWTGGLRLASESAQVVIGTFDSPPDESWVQVKREQRIRADVLSTVHACLGTIGGAGLGWARRSRAVLERKEEELREAREEVSRLRCLLESAGLSGGVSGGLPGGGVSGGGVSGGVGAEGVSGGVGVEGVEVEVEEGEGEGEGEV